MRNSRAGKSRFPVRLAEAAGLLTLAGVATAVAVEIRHRRAVAGDPQWALLRAPLQGERVVSRSADGTELNAEVFGPDGAPTFVLVPGWTEELQIFDLLTRELIARGFRVVAFDPRGQGASGCAADLDQQMERYGEDIAAVLATTCGGRDDVILVGHSMGGMSLVAWASQVDVAQHVRAAALISTGMSSLIDELALLPAAIPQSVRSQILTPLLAGDRPMVTISTPLSRALNRHVMFGPQATAAHVAFVEPMVWRMNPKLRAGAARTMRELDLSEALGRLTVPTLVVVGDSDRLTPQSHARRMVAALPHVAEFVLLHDTGHMTTLERPQELADALCRLAESVGLEPAGEAASAVS